MEEVDHSMVSKSFVEADFRKTVFSMACTWHEKADYQLTLKFTLWLIWWKLFSPWSRQLTWRLTWGTLTALWAPTPPPRGFLRF
jgi:hypothetical protein